MDTTLSATQEAVGRVETALDIANSNFDHWNEILQTGDAAAVAALYTEDATFLPTVMSRMNGRQKAEEYFDHFLKKNPFGTIIEDTVRELSSDILLHEGLYDFEVGPESGRSVVHARFTFIWMRDEDNEWAIIHHHSSVNPE